jgi:dienelactone hydrolase
MNALSRRGFLSLGAAAGLAAACPLRAFEEPNFETLEYDWADGTRQRPVPVRLYLPRTAQRVPLVVMSHGIGGSRRGYSWLGTYLASNGLAALHLQHVGSDRQVWTGNPLGVVGRLQDAAQDREAIARAQDLRFALDQVLSSEHAARFDAGRIAAAGHSYGANTALLASGARVQREGRLVDLRDERIRAAIIMSAPPFYGEREPQRILGSVTLPTLHVTCTEDIIRIPGYYSGFEDRLAVFDATGSARKWLAVFEGGSHSVFTDRAGTGGTALNPQVKMATRGLALAFLRDVWDGDPAALRAWPREHSALLARFSAPGA